VPQCGEGKLSQDAKLENRNLGKIRILGNFFTWVKSLKLKKWG